MKAGIEYNEYYQQYIKKALETPLIEGLDLGLSQTVSFFESIPESKHEFRYAEGKWTPKEVLLHIIDTERVFAYRALQFARADDVNIEGFDQDEFVKNARPVTRSMNDLIEEYRAVRAATLQFAKGCSPEVLKRNGVASNSPLSVRAALYIICGHEIHHCAIIQERYL